jgi:hypothetical protein
MAAVEPGSSGASLLARVRSLVLRPERAWDAIAAEPATPNEIYKAFVVPLAAVPSVCGLVGVLVFGGFHIASVGVHPTLASSLIEAVMSYALTLVLVFFMAVVIEVAAGLFGGVRDRGQAFKLAAYSGAAFWAAGIFALYPSLTFPAGVLGGLYSLYTLNLGLPKLMKVDRERALTCFAVILVAAIVLALLKGEITARAAEVGGPLIAF